MGTIDIATLAKAAELLRALSDMQPSQIQANPELYGRLQGRALVTAIAIELRLPKLELEIVGEGKAA